MKFRWTTRGTESGAGSPGANRYADERAGVVEAEGTGEVVDWLAKSSDAWDALDQQETLTITIVPLVAVSS